MRITNNMMQNNSLNNIAVNKRQMNRLDNQLSTQKKISRPSEDPIIAIRALRLRTSLNEVTQYLDKNIPDANSWLDVTEGALTEVDSIVSDVYKYCVQGSTDSLSLSERKIIADSIKQLREALYSQGDADYAGRYVFTGFRTDKSLTYNRTEDLLDANYTITQNFSSSDMDTKTVITGTVDVDSILKKSGAEIAGMTEADVANVADANSITSQVVHRIKLAYEGTQGAGTISFTKEDGTAIGLTVTDVTDPTKVPTGNEVFYNKETGEFLLGDDAYETLYNAGNFSITYDKTDFKVGDCRPEHYFTCVQHKADGTDLDYVRDSVGQDVEYIINFNQKLKVNSEAADCLSLYIGRDIDEIYDAVSKSVEIEENLNKLKELKANPNYSSDAAQENIDRMIEATQKELDHYNDILQKTFEAGITKMQNHQETIDIGIADIGNRMTRLELTKTRLESQKTNFTKLKSENEDVNLEETVINYSSTELVYNASLTAASKAVRQTLLDFL